MKRNILSFGSIPLLFCFFVISCSKKDSSPPLPIADFTYSGAGLAPATVSFTSTSSNSSTYSWDFGDNATSSEENPNHVYTKGGVYTVKLTVNGAGGSNSVVKTVNIQSPTSVKIIGIKLLGMPFTSSSGAGWDISNGPDVFCTVTDNSDNVLLTGGTINDVTAIPPNLVWSVNPSYQITNLSASYKFKIWDFDTPDADDFIGGYSIPFSAFASAGYPTNPVLQITGDPLKIELVLLWQ